MLVIRAVYDVSEESVELLAAVSLQVGSQGPDEGEQEQPLQVQRHLM